VHGHSEGALECAAEVAAAQVHRARDFRNLESGIDVRIHVTDRAIRLPSGEAAGHGGVVFQSGLGFGHVDSPMGMNVY
jgi:hypothetical protein